MNVFNGTVTFLDSKPVTCLQTDACLHGGAGYYEGDFFYVNWDTDLPNFKNYHINIKETMSIVLSAMRWGHLWANKRVVVSTDNMTTKCIINKGSSRNKTLMTQLRELFWLSATHNFDIRAKFISGRNNVIADAASRLHEPGQLSRLYDKLQQIEDLGKYGSDLQTFFGLKKIIAKTATANQYLQTFADDGKLDKMIFTCEINKLIPGFLADVKSLRNNPITDNPWSYYTGKCKEYRGTVGEFG
ncbi:unnamed protein product [Mytilus edulis]|uniref:Uncharacterized protein n=1 Tax=Mytilus edulis TaxID=6550 RepID=A0A8S3UR83_MYTED|nr:unnamed protein product [Mytilus edulis]